MEVNVVQGAFAPRRLWQSKRFWVGLGVVAVVLLGVVAIVVVVHHRDVERRAKAAVKVEQAALQMQLNQSVLSSQNQTTVTAATQLINGVNSKKFTIASGDLGQIYLERAGAYLNLKQTSPALADYQKAINLNGQVKIAALQGELSIESQLGNKQAMIPILQQLIQLYQNSEMPMAGSQAAQYQAAIQSIQSGQEVSF